VKHNPGRTYNCP